MKVGYFVYEKHFVKWLFAICPLMVRDRNLFNDEQ